MYKAAAVYLDSMSSNDAFCHDIDKVSIEFSLADDCFAGTDDAIYLGLEDSTSLTFIAEGSSAGQTITPSVNVTEVFGHSIIQLYDLVGMNLFVQPAPHPIASGDVKLKVGILLFYDCGSQKQARDPDSTNTVNQGSLYEPIVFSRITCSKIRRTLLPTLAYLHTAQYFNMFGMATWRRQRGKLMSRGVVLVQAVQ